MYLLYCSRGTCNTRVGSVSCVFTNRQQEQHRPFSVGRECRIPFICDNSQQTGLRQPPHRVAVLLKPGPAGTASELFSNNTMTIPAFHPPSLPYECNGREKASSTDSPPLVGLSRDTNKIPHVSAGNRTPFCLCVVVVLPVQQELVLLLLLLLLLLHQK